MGSKPLRVKHVTQLTATKHRFEKSLKESLISTTENPNCELLLAYYASEVSMNKRIKSLYEVIFAHDENEIFEINLSHINLDVKSAYHLKIILQYFSNIRDLKLSNCNLNSKNLKRLSRSLPNFTKLNTFHFSENGLDLDGLVLMTQFFKHWPRLNILNLNGNNLMFEGFRVLAEGLECLLELNELYLNNNHGRDESCEILATAVKKLYYLETFEMARNGLTTEGVSEILSSFNKKVLHGNFEGNEISPSSSFLIRARFPKISLNL